MYELILQVLAGSFGGAMIAAYLSKKLVENQLNKTLKKYQHELDVKKDVLAADLSLHANHQILKLTKHEEAKRNAIHNIYNAIIMTSIPRVGFKKMRSLEQCKDEIEFRTIYFESFSKNFNAFNVAFNAISNAYAVIEQESIYIDQKLESEVISCLRSIQRVYDERHSDLIHGHNKAKLLLEQSNLKTTTMPFDITKFYDESTTIWAAKTFGIRDRLKATMREVLSN